MERIQCEEKEEEEENKQKRLIHVKN